jgi:hypothetical protein
MCFCAVEPQAGKHFTFATPDRSAAEFAPVASHLVRKYPDATTIHLVVDNLNIHRRKALTDYCGETAGNWIRGRSEHTAKRNPRLEPPDES